MCRAMAWPWSGPNTRARSTSMSSVPASSSTRVVDVFVIVGCLLCDSRSSTVEGLDEGRAAFCWSGRGSALTVRGAAGVRRGLTPSHRRDPALQTLLRDPAARAHAEGIPRLVAAARRRGVLHQLEIVRGDIPEDGAGRILIAKVPIVDSKRHACRN